MGIAETGQAFTAGEGRAGQLGHGQSVLTAQQPCLLVDLVSDWQVGALHVSGLRRILRSFVLVSTSEAICDDWLEEGQSKRPLYSSFCHRNQASISK